MIVEASAASISPTAGLRQLLRSDIAAFARRSGKSAEHPGWGFALRYLMFHSGFHYVMALRIQFALGHIPGIGRALRRAYALLLCRFFGCEVSPGAIIGEGFYVPHPYAIVIGNRTWIGNNVTILQSVTIGVKSKIDASIGRIEDGAFLGAGAVVIGAVTVGAGAVVGANAVVVRDVPAGATAVGNPARVLSRDASTPC